MILQSQTAAASTSSRQQLSEQDITALMNLVHIVSDKWIAIGIGLGFTPSELNQISSKPLLLATAPTSFLMELLSQWTQWPTKLHPTKPTLDALCLTLSSSLVGLGSLAETVEKEMKPSKQYEIILIISGVYREQSLIFLVYTVKKEVLW